MTRVKVATYNIWMGGKNRPALREAVRKSRPNVLLVNETPKWILLWRRQCRKLAEEWGMRYVVGGRPAGSNMILVAPGVEVRGSAAEVLPQPRFQPRRGIAWAQLRVHGKPLGVISCHLSLDRTRRLAETDRVIAVARRLNGPVVLGGDLNEPPTGPCWRKLREAGFADHGSESWPTYPANAPESRIDALLVRGKAEVVKHGDPDVSEAVLSVASDHRPVAAVLDIP